MRMLENKELEAVDEGKRSFFSVVSGAVFGAAAGVIQEGAYALVKRLHRSL